MKKDTEELLTLMFKTLGFIAVVLIAIIYAKVVIEWSNADYCKRGIAIEEVCN